MKEQFNNQKPFEYLKKLKGCPNISQLWRPTRNFLLAVEKKLIKLTQGRDHCEQIFGNAISALETGNTALALELLEVGQLELKQIIGNDD